MPRLERDKKIVYMDETFGQEDSLLKAIQKQTKEEGVERMQISPHEGQILHCLTLLAQAKKVVEIGTLYGYSTAHIARALPEEGLIFTCDTSKKRHEEAQNIFKSHPEYKKIRWITGPALETLSSLESQGPFDMVFIDADKGSYGKYLEWAEKNLRSKGLVVGDNTFLFGSVYDSTLPSRHPPETVKIIKGFNQFLASSLNFTGAIIPTAEGLTIGIKK